MPTDDTRTFVIVGAAHAGGKAIETLRKEGFGGRIVAAGAESHVPYMRPELSKEYLRGENGPESSFIHPEKFYHDNDVDLRTGTTAVRISPHAAEVTLSDGSRIHYDKLLLATGARPRRLGIPGDDSVCVEYLRTFEDADRIKAGLKKGKHVVAIGGGWISLEVAAAARAKGARATVVSRNALPLVTLLGKEVASVYKRMHEEHGVEFVRGTPKKFLGEGRVRQVDLGRGRVIDCDLVVVGIGAEPEVALAREAGLEIKDGAIAVNEYLETSAKDIFAAGDCAAAFHPFFERHRNVQHWGNAHNQGAAAAKNLLGQHAPYELLPYFFSDQYDTYMESTGMPAAWDKVAFRGDPEARKFAAFWILDSRLVGGMVVNSDVKIPMLEAIINSRRPVDAAKLEDPGIPLATFL